METIEMSPLTNTRSRDTDRGGAAEDRDSIYRQHLAEVILQHITKNGTVDNIDAFREVISVTQRSIGTVKNWLVYKVTLPDLASLARIVDHWKIPVCDIFPLQLASLLAGESNYYSDADINAQISKPASDKLFLSLFAPTDSAKLEFALSRYTEHPKETFFVRQDSSEMLEQIRPGELLLIDPTCENIRGSGMYLLKLTTPGQPDKTCVRVIDTLLSEPGVRLSMGSASPTSSSETVPLNEGLLPSHITVLGRVAAVLRQT